MNKAEKSFWNLLQQRKAYKEVLQMPIAKIDITPQSLLMTITQIQAASVFHEDALNLKRIIHLGKQLQSHVKWPEAIESLINLGWERIDQRISGQPIDASNAVPLFNNLIESADDQQSSQPISHYMDTNILVIAAMEREYGSNLEGMPRPNKLLLIQQLAVDVAATLIDTGEVQQYTDLGESISREISEVDDAINLIKAIADNL